MRKELALELKKNILLIDENEIYLSDHEFYVQDEWRNTDFKLICKGDELNEEILDSILKGMYEECYIKSRNIPQLYNSGLATYVGDPMVAFKKQIESKGFWWERHAIAIPYSTSKGFDEWDEDGRIYDDVLKFQEAEAKTFNPKTTYIFEYATRVV